MGSLNLEIQTSQGLRIKPPYIARTGEAVVLKAVYVYGANEKSIIAGIRLKFPKGTEFDKIGKIGNTVFFAPINRWEKVLLDPKTRTRHSVWYALMFKKPGNYELKVEAGFHREGKVDLSERFTLRVLPDDDAKKRAKEAEIEAVFIKHNRGFTGKGHSFGL